MSDEAVERLRELARRYAEGQLSRGDYLSMRTGLLDAVTSQSQRLGAGEPVVQDAPAACPVSDESLGETPTAGPAPRERLVSDADPPPAATRTTLGKNRALVGTALGVGLTVVVLATLWLVFAGPGSDAEVSTTAAPQKVSVAESVKPSARSRVEAFMARNDWSSPAIGGFLSAWEELPESPRRDTLGAAWFKPLADELNERIAEQQALADIRGPDGGSREYETLIAFAERLGLRERTIRTSGRPNDLPPPKEQTGGGSGGAPAVSAPEAVSPAGKSDAGTPSSQDSRVEAMPAPGEPQSVSSVPRGW